MDMITEDWLKSKGVNVPAERWYLKVGNHTPWHLAAKTDNVELAQGLLEAGVDCRCYDSYGRTPLHLAAYDGRRQVAELLLRAGADINALEDENKQTPLEAALCGRYKTDSEAEDLVSLLLDNGARINYSESLMGSPLHLAAEKGFLATAQLLMDYGADPALMHSQKTPLHAALKYAKVNKVGVKALLEMASLLANSHTVNLTNDRRQTALHLALTTTKPAPLVKLLLSRGADTDSRDIYGKTPLYVAYETHQGQLGRILLETGARDLGKDHNGRTALYFAVCKYRAECQRLLSLDKVDIQRHFDIATKLGHGHVCQSLFQLYRDQIIIGIEHLDMAIQNWSQTGRRDSTVSFLFDQVGPEVAMLERQGYTLLSHACRIGNAGVVQAILESKYGKELLHTGTPHPLLIAASAGHIEVMSSLLKVIDVKTLDQHRLRAPDGTDPLTLTMARGKWGTYDTEERMGQISSVLKLLYSDEELGEASIGFGKVLEFLAKSNIEFHVAMCHLKTAILSGDKFTVDYVLQEMKHQGKNWPIPETDTLSILESISKYLNSKDVSMSPKKSDLVELSEEFPVFNGDVEKQGRPEEFTPRHDAYMYGAIDVETEIDPIILEEFCCLKGRGGSLLNHEQLDIKSCNVDDCRQMVECAKVEILLRVLHLLANDLRENGLPWLSPHFNVVGSTTEGSRLKPANEIDCCITFQGLDNWPMTLDPENACELLLKDKSPLAAHGFSHLKDDNLVFTYPTFLGHILKVIKASLVKLRDQSPKWPANLAIDVYWSQDNCQNCQDKYLGKRTSRYAPHTHCQECRPAVTHTKSGICLIFTFGPERIPLTVDLVPLYPVVCPPKGVMAISEAVTRTLLERKPENWNRYFHQIVYSDRLHPDDYAKLVPGSNGKLLVNLKILNYSDKDPVIVRPSFNLKQRALVGPLKITYVRIKALKSLLGVDCSSFLIKKVLLNDYIVEEVSDPKLHPGEALHICLSNPELKNDFKDFIDYGRWERNIVAYKRGDSNTVHIPLSFCNYVDFFKRFDSSSSSDED